MTDIGSTGIGFIGLLTLLFIGLKLTGYIAWSWVWVWAPIWGAAVIIALVGVLAVFLEYR